SETNVEREAVAYNPGPCGGIWGLEDVTVPGNPMTDSFDSTEGLGYSEFSAKSNGDICSGGPVTVGGSVDINGDVMAAPGYPVIQHGGALDISGAVTQWSGKLRVPAVEFGDVATNNDNGTIGLTDNGNDAFSGSGLFIAAEDNLTLAPGTYFFDSVGFGKHAGVKAPGSLTVTGPTAIYLTGDFDITGSGTINSTGDPHDLTILSSGSRVMITGNAQFRMRTSSLREAPSISAQ
ncbi:MAG: hypothetical protein ACYS7M_12795, partial [Planctomycetota bacterium]